MNTAPVGTLGAVKRDRVAHHQMRFQAELVDVVQAFANPERGDGAAVQVHAGAFDARRASAEQAAMDAAAALFGPRKG